MWNYIRNKLGLDKIDAELAKLPALDARHRQVLTAIESVMNTLQSPTPDDGLIMFHLRCMGYAGGWKVKDKIEDTVHKSMQDWKTREQQ